MVIVEKTPSTRSFNCVLKFNVTPANFQAFRPYWGAWITRWQTVGMAPPMDLPGDAATIVKRCIISEAVIDRVLADAQTIETAYLNNAPVPKL